MSHPVNRISGAPQQPLTPSEDRQWAFIAHCGGILGCVPSLLIYKLIGPRGRFTAQESLEALNFTLPPTILAIFLNVLALIFSFFIPAVGSMFAMVALFVWILLTVFSVIAAIRVNRGQPYRYAWNLRYFK
ncbi:hypothetical protein SAMN04489740_1616 [Arthrobacter alpinus]|uniref:Orotate phosphoribosyltransferase n=1 Tax=Arthrobacter alpinus TaxID=656366 RepID=A0A1H5JHS2_9MICC|nr:DUF4870 domain-containing protein [Arthrobacter alpinus]SEE51787.1 hypothetical protein SAMN04489740_1616 [Arthrobacter alpinus]